MKKFKYLCFVVFAMLGIMALTDTAEAKEALPGKISIDTVTAVPQTGGHLYKYISHSVSGKTSSYTGTITQTNSASISFGIPTSYGTVGVQLATSTARKFKQYINTATVKSTWAVYDKYSGRFMYNTTISNYTSWYSYVGI